MSSRLNQSISFNNFSGEEQSDCDAAGDGGCNGCGAMGFGNLGFGLDAQEMLAAYQKDLHGSDLDSNDLYSNDLYGNDLHGSHLYGSDSSHYSHFTAPHHFFLPIHYAPTYRYPLIVWLHNDGFNETQIEQLMPHISLRNYIAVGVRGNRAADSAGHRFDWHDSASAIETAHHRVIGAIDEAASQFSVHPDRVVLAGYRGGGTMALRIAMRDPSRFAAVASFGGRMPSGGNVFGDLNTLRRHRLSMLWQWAEDDACYQPDSLKEDIQSALTINAKVDILQYKGDDEMNTAALSELNQWIMSRVVSGVATASAAADRWSSSPTGFSSN